MTESEAKKWINTLKNWNSILSEAQEACEIAENLFEEIQQYRAIGTIEELQELKENGAFTGVELAQIAVNQMELKKYMAIGTVDEFKALKENQRKCEDCAGCTAWNCDCANERAYAIDEFANFIHKKAKGNNGLRLSGETRSWTHASIFDYVNEFKEQMKGGEIKL